MILTDLRSPLAKCVLCAWFNEWHRFGERDQLSLSYVLHSMGLSPPSEATSAASTSSFSEAQVSGGSPPRLPKRRAKGRTHSADAHRGVYLWPRHDHWHYKRNRAAGELKRPAFVKYVGHGGCQAKGSDKTNPGCARKKPKAHSAAAGSGGARSVATGAGAARRREA